MTKATLWFDYYCVECGSVYQCPDSDYYTNANVTALPKQTTKQEIVNEHIGSE